MDDFKCFERVGSRIERRLLPFCLSKVVSVQRAVNQGLNGAPQFIANVDWVCFLAQVPGVWMHQRIDLSLVARI
jgi:hypothetical protein